MNQITKLPIRRSVAETSTGTETRAMLKGQQTKAAIVEAAMGLATHLGLEGLSIGVVAEVTQMSKSGVFAHFGSREELQISVIREYFNQFEQEVFYPALEAKRGLPRLRVLFDKWMRLVAGEVQAGIDVSNLEELMWAMLTRSDPATSIDIITKTWSTPLDPSVSPEQKESGDNTNSRAIIDACRPFHWRDKFPKVNMPSPETARKAMAKFGYLLK